MVSDSARELARVASFLGRACTNEEIDQAVQRSSADTMRQLEKSQSQLFTSTKDTRKDIPFVRAAKAGGWRTALSEESAARIEEAWGHLISWLGYEALNGGMQAGNSSERNQQADFLVGPRS